jgi:hypothetical protein
MLHPINTDRRRLLGAAILTATAADFVLGRAPHLDANAYAKKFSGKYAHRTVTGRIGHNLAQEAPPGLCSGCARCRPPVDQLPCLVTRPRGPTLCRRRQPRTDT